MKKRTSLLVALLAVLLAHDALAQAISSRAAAQIRAIVTDKKARTQAQRKIDSKLIYAARIQQGLPAVDGVPTLR